MRVRLITKQDSLANIAWNIFGMFQGSVTVLKPNKDYLLLNEEGEFLQKFETEQEAINYIKVFEYELL